MKQSEIDPRVSCPIVCGGFMGASGFFFATAAQTYLVTARHNLLPTDASTLAVGKWPIDFETEDILPTIDIYLRDGDSHARCQIDIRNTTGVRFHASLDVIGIPIDFSPQDYGYTVWTSADIISPESTDNTVDSIGFPGDSFPSSNGAYDADQYANEITNPYLLTLQTEVPAPCEITDDTGLIELGFRSDSGTESSQYDGFSGSPVLGDGLVGVHMANQRFISNRPEVDDFDDIMSMQYWRADILPKLLSD